MNCYFCSNYSSNGKATTVLLTWPQTAFPGNLFPGWSSQRRFQAQNAWNLFERVETYDSTVRIAIGNENGTYNFPSRSTATKRVPPPAVDPLWYPLTAGDHTIYREGLRLHQQACPTVNWTPQRALPLPTAPLLTVFPEYLWPGAPVIQKAEATLDGIGAYVYFLQPGGINGPNGVITNYKYTIDGGTTYITFSPAQTSSPILITPLTNSVAAKTIQLVAIGLSTCGLVQLSGLSNSIQNPLVPLPLLYFDAQYNNNSTIINSATGNFSTMTGTAFNVTYPYGPNNFKVFDFNGTSSYIRFGNYNFGNEITVTAWIKPSDSTNTINGLLANTTADISSNGFIIGWNSNPRFIPMPSTLKWSQASSYAAARGLQLATAAQVREYLTTNYGGKGAFDGDWWAPVADGQNYWIAIGRAYPERAGKLHQEIDNGAYGLPPWGEDSSSFYWRGWMPVTSQTNRLCHFDAGNGSQRGANATSTAITYGVWQHFGCVFDRANGLVKFFINGVPVNIDAISTLANIGMNNSSFNIGAIIGQKYYMKAQMGYIKVYETLFDTTAVLNEYMNTKSRFGL